MMDLYYFIQRDQVSSDPCLEKVVKEFLQKVARFQKEIPHEETQKLPLRDIIEMAILKEIERGEMEGRKVWLGWFSCPYFWMLPFLKSDYIYKKPYGM